MPRKRQRIFRRGRIFHGWFYEADGTKRTRSTRCTDRDAAEAVVARWEREAGDPTYAATQAATLTDALLLLLRNREQKAKVGKGAAATVDFYETKAGHLVRIFERADGARVPFKIAALTATAVDAYIEQRQREGVTEHTISKELTTLRAALKLAKRAGIWRGDIDAVMPVGFSPQYKPKTRHLTPDELQLLLAQLSEDHAARVAFIVATSACWGETERAMRDDVAADLSSVFIRGTKRATRERTTPVVDEQMRGLLRYALDHAKGEGGALFMKWSNARRDLHAACERAKIAPCSPNDLRRTFAHWQKDAGVPNDLIAPAMGHADTRMVERVYGRQTPEELRRAYDAVFNGAKVSALLQSLTPHEQRALVTLSAEQFRAFIELAKSPRHCSAGAADSAAIDGLNGLPELAADDVIDVSAEIKTPPEGGVVPRAGIEPATRGFSVLVNLWPTPRKQKEGRSRRTPNAAPVQPRGPLLHPVAPRLRPR